MPAPATHLRGRMRVGALAIFLAAGSAGWITGCVPKDPGFADGGACSFQNVPTTCPASAPSFSIAVQGSPAVNDVIQTTCTDIGCHVPGGQESNTLLQTYAEISAAVNATNFSFAGYVVNCTMPPVGNPQLTKLQQSALLAWIACGAPDN